MAHRLSVLQLYSHLLRIGRYWPKEENRPGRNLHDRILLRIREEFKKNKNASESDIPNLIKQGNAEIEAMEELLVNKWGSRYTFREGPYPQVINNRKELLSTSAVEKSKGTKKKKNANPWVRRFVELLVGKYPEAPVKPT